jgi:hypothetical protein
MNRFSSRETLTGIEVHYEVRTIDAVCINCNKRFTSMRGVTTHLKMTAARHVVNFINYGNYDKKTGLKARLGQTLFSRNTSKSTIKAWNSFVTPTTI